MDWKGMAGVCLGIVLALGGRAVGQEKDAAALPPLGWNSWDAYGLSITAAEWEENVRWFHTHLQPAGWQYVVLDEGWYLAHPERAGGKGDQGYTMDANGEFVPAPGRFPDGIAGLAAEAHGLGVKVWDPYHSRDPKGCGRAESADRGDEAACGGCGGYERCVPVESG